MGLTRFKPLATFTSKVRAVVSADHHNSLTSIPHIPFTCPSTSAKIREVRYVAKNL